MKIVTALATAGFVLMQASMGYPADPGRNSNELTGLFLLQMCEGQTGEQMDALVCTTFLAGFARGLKYGVDSCGLVHGKQSKIRQLCFPKAGVEIGQTVLIVTKWLKDHPERLHEQADSLVVRALMDAFGCPQE
jgi:hypothetical protein